MKTLAIALFALFATGIAHGQVRDYGFGVEGPIGRPSFFYGGSSDEGDQTLFSVPIIDSMVHYPGASQYVFMNNGAPSTDSVVNGPGFPIGFDFFFDGEVFDRFGVSANMYIKLGKSSDGVFSMYNDTAAGGVFHSGKDTLRANVIAALQTSSEYLKTYQLTVKTGLFGYPGERVRKVYIDYWKVIAGWSHWHTVYISFLERENKIVLFYVSRYLPANTNGQMYCGLRGGKVIEIVDSNFKSLSVIQGINTWKTPMQADSPEDLCELKNGFTPDSMSYIFVPPYSFNIPSCPVSHFRETNYVNPNHIAIEPSYNNQGGYYFANGAVQVPVNPVLWWSPGDPRDTLLFDVYLGLDSIGFWPVGEDVPTNSLPLGFLAANTRYFYKVVAKNGMGRSPSCVGSFVTNDQLEYCVSQQRYHANGLYDSLILHTFLYKHPAPGTLDTQSYFPPVTPHTTTLMRDSSYRVRYTKVPSAPNCHTFKVWIDFNHNGLFSDPGEEFNGNNVMITVPADAKLGLTRMRVSTLSSCVGVNMGSCPSNARYYQDFTITIVPSTACSGFTLGYTATDPFCHGDSSGMIALLPIGGTPPYSISWEYMGNALPDTGDTLANLPTGTYQAFVTDAAGCPLQTPIIPLVQPYPFAVDTATVAGELRGVANGGTPPYLFEWLDSNGTVADSLIPGTYTLTGTDANGCSATLYPVTIPELPDTNPCPLPPCDTIPNPCPNPPCDTLVPCDVPPCDTVGIGSFENDLIDIKVYPNPSNGILYIETNHHNGSFELYSLLGEWVAVAEMEKGKVTSLTITNLASGVYVYRIKSSGIERYGRVVIQQ